MKRPRFLSWPGKVVPAYAGNPTPGIELGQQYVQVAFTDEREPDRPHTLNLPVHAAESLAAELIRATNQIYAENRAAVHRSVHWERNADHR